MNNNNYLIFHIFIALKYRIVIKLNYFKAMNQFFPLKTYYSLSAIVIRFYIAFSTYNMSERAPERSFATKCYPCRTMCSCVPTAPVCRKPSLGG